LKIQSKQKKLNLYYWYCSPFHSLCLIINSSLFIWFQYFLTWFFIMYILYLWKLWMEFLVFPFQFLLYIVSIKNISSCFRSTP
jgi:hypothetical protein